MKYLIMCEGSNEKKIIELLIGNDKLVESIREYKIRNNSHGDDQHYLLELLKNN